MKRFVFIYLLIFISCSTITEGISNLDVKKGRKEYKKYVRQIKRPNYPINIDSLDFPVEKLYNLSKVKSHYIYQFIAYPSPTKENIKDWKKWYKMNKNNIYFDKKYKIIKVTNNVKYIDKNPKELFFKYYNLIKRMDDKKHYYVEEFDYTNYKLHNLTNISINDDMIYIEETESSIYNKITFDKWIKWFELNKDNLIWDIEKQEMTLKQD